MTKNSIGEQLTRRRQHHSIRINNINKRIGVGLKIIDTVAKIRKEQIEEGRRMVLAENNALKLGIKHE